MLQDLLEKRLRLAQLPTPIEYMPRISKRLGIELYLKRDDLTESIASGNKIRKLEYLLCDARERGADAVITCGGVQSNHCRATAYAAAKMGMAAVLLLRGEEPTGLQGNLLINRLLGAECRFFTPGQFRRLPLIEEDVKRDLQKLGKTPYIIPLGGSNATGSLGYVRMMQEIHEADFHADHLYCALGSGGTLAGILAGKQHFGFTGKVCGIAVSDDTAYFVGETRRIQQEYADWYGIEIDFGDLGGQMDDSYIGKGYALNTQAEWEQLIDLARLEGLVLDPVYTLKAFLGMMDHCRTGKIAAGEKVLFIHTGGHSGIFPKVNEFEGLL